MAYPEKKRYSGFCLKVGPFLEIFAHKTEKEIRKFLFEKFVLLPTSFKTLIKCKYRKWTFPKF
jgi:hypothetical protein